MWMHGRFTISTCAKSAKDFKQSSSIRRLDGALTRTLTTRKMRITRAAEERSMSMKTPNYRIDPEELMMRERQGCDLLFAT